MNTAFGALIRSRRRSLRLTQAQLAQRMESQGHLVSVGPLERGVAGVLPRETLTALATALEWPIQTMELVSGKPTGALVTPSPIPSWSDTGRINHQQREQLTAIREELVALQALHDTLQQWTDDLEARVNSLLAGLPSWRRPVRFDD